MPNTGSTAAVRQTRGEDDTESAQMLSTAHHEFGSERAVYKSTHKNHPSTVWARECTANYNWLYVHMMALGMEYTRRYGKSHLTIQKCCDALLEPPEGCQSVIDIRHHPSVCLTSTKDMMQSKRIACITSAKQIQST